MRRRDLILVAVGFLVLTWIVGVACGRAMARCPPPDCMDRMATDEAVDSLDRKATDVALDRLMAAALDCQRRCSRCR